MARRAGRGDNRGLHARHQPAAAPSGQHRTILWLLLGAGLVLSALGYYVTGSTSSEQSLPGRDGLSTAIYEPIHRDERLYFTATTLASLADTADERAYAAQTQHLADGVLDLGFTIALQQAAAVARPANAPSGPAAQRIANARAAVAADQSAVRAAQQAAENDRPHRNQANEGVEPLAVAQAQLDLDQARLKDAIDDASRDSDSVSQRLLQLQQEHEAMHGTAQRGTALQSQLASQAQERNPNLARGLVGQLRAAWLLNDKLERLRQAEAAASGAVPAILEEHNQLHAALVRDEAQLRQGASAGNDRLARLHALSDEQRQISRFDDQADTATQLAAIYGRWVPIAASQRLAAMHRAMRSLLLLLGLGAILLAFLAAVEGVFRHSHWERKRAMTLRHLLRLTAETVAAMFGLMIFFGQPAQLFTVIGLAGAGLAVAFQDAILSVAGWFVLIGPAGVHLGDWVEINGVVGEVVEVRLLKTVLLETGNWITAGHPTGRRVFFPNSFALKGSYFNFSTAGQWLWDEVQVQLPAGMDAHAAATRVQKALDAELAPAAERADHEWQHLHGHAPVSTAPTVQLRPEGEQFHLIVRYTVPAKERTAMRERIWNVIGAALERAGRSASDEAATA